MPVGFYYKTLIRPRLMWRLAEPVIRRLAGLGSLKHSNGKPAHYEHQHQHTEVAVAGGGATGMAAALAAAEAGAQVVLVESEPELGGRLRSQSGPVADPDTGARRSGDSSWPAAGPARSWITPASGSCPAHWPSAPMRGGS